MLKYPIGYSDFRDIIQEERVLVDKTLMIPRIMDDAKVLLFTRPRRFGKTLNLSMLKYFFSCQEENTADLFKGLNIHKAPKSYWQHQGKYPVIMLSLKDIKTSDFKSAYESISDLISRLYDEHNYLLASDLLNEPNKERFNSTLRQQLTSGQLKSSLQTLCIWLFKYYGEKPLLLIDEYDTPIHTAYVKDYYAEMIDFMREFLGITLKDDSHFYKAVITGILRVSKENLFSGLNNIEVYSFLSPKYAEYFGFTEEEVNVLFKKADLKHDAQQIKDWYNGYQVDSKTLYNPWSIISCIKHGGKLSPYWVNTSDNALIGKLLVTGGHEVQQDFEKLMQGQKIETVLNEHLTFQQFTNNRVAILNLLFMAGYLNAIAEDESLSPVQGEPLYQLRIPNQEVHNLYHWLIYEWLSGNSGELWFPRFLQELREGKLDIFERKLAQLMQNVFSYYDLKTKTPEQFFHGFTLGLVADMQKDYVIKSNREGGEGRYDVALIPKDEKAGLQGFIFEIKSVDCADQDELKLHAQKALEQIEALGYDQEMTAQNVSKLTKIGMAFSGKKIAMASRVTAQT
jgi:hypothetical protein